MRLLYVGLGQVYGSVKFGLPIKFGTDEIFYRRLLQALEATGLRKSDPRLKEMVANIEKYKRSCEKDVKELVIGRKQFKS